MAWCQVNMERVGEAEKMQIHTEVDILKSLTHKVRAHTPPLVRTRSHRMHARVCVCMYPCVYMRVRTCACTCVYMYMHTYVRRFT